MMVVVVGFLLHFIKRYSNSNPRWRSTANPYPIYAIHLLVNRAWKGSPTTLTQPEGAKLVTYPPQETYMKTMFIPMPVDGSMNALKASNNGFLETKNLLGYS